MKKTIAVCGTALLSAALFAAPGGRPGAPAHRQEVRVVKPAHHQEVRVVKPAPRPVVKVVKPAPRPEVRVVKPAPRPVVKVVKPLPPKHRHMPPPPRPWWKFW